VIAFTGHHSFDSFKKNIQQLNELETYTQLIARAAQCGFRISKLVYRGYGAPDSLQRMHDEAIESRTRLQLERATREQAQDLEDFSLERTLARAGRQRQEQELALAHELAASEQKRAAELKDKLERRTAARELEKADAEQSRELRQKETEVENVRLESLQKLGVDLTTYLTKNRADTRIEIAGGSPVHVEAAPMRLAGHRS
jgi:molybdopterin-biosynthesis enzyme MoeA-like protein